MKMRFIDLTGRRFSRLTVTGQSGRKHNEIMWRCRCECGNEVVVSRSRLKSGNTMSCGCLHSEVARERRITHGLTNHRIYKIYNNMIGRCYYPSSTSYPNYGERGITVCDEWRGENGFECFSEWAFENGYSDELSIDRKDVNGHYEPSNCRWSTDEDQANNRRTNRFITIEGITKTVSQWSSQTGIHRETLTNRINRGWSQEDLLRQPRKTGREEIGSKKSG